MTGRLVTRDDKGSAHVISTGREKSIQARAKINHRDAIDLSSLRSLEMTCKSVCHLGRDVYKELNP